MFTFARPRTSSELPELMPKPVTIYDPVVRLRADMSDPDITEMQLPHHFTNIQHAMQLGRRYLTNQDTPNRQMILITDGLPTAHFEGNMLYMLYPPDPRTEEATMREAQLCAKEGIVLNIFLLQSWSQSSEDVQFAYKMARMTKGRVIFTAGKDLDRFVVWDYIKMRKSNCIMIESRIYHRVCDESGLLADIGNLQFPLSPWADQSANLIALEANQPRPNGIGDDADIV